MDTHVCEPGERYHLVVVNLAMHTTHFSITHNTLISHVDVA